MLVIPDGAAQPVRAGELQAQPVRAGELTALESASTPVLDALAAEGGVGRVATTPAGLSAGSEIGIPTLLGCAPATQTGRGRVDAAAAEIDVPAGLVPWRADLVTDDGRRATAAQARAACAELGPGAYALGGHRLLLLSAARPADRSRGGLQLRVWRDGPAPARRLPGPTTVVCARGAAAGCARLLGAEVLLAPGATGDVNTDLGAKVSAVADAIAAGAKRVVVHVGAPDEAAHRREPQAVIAALERVDVELLGPLRELVASIGGRLAVCPDHGTDPATGRHSAAPVPALVWGAGIEPAGPSRLTERLTRASALLDPASLLPAAASLLPAAASLLPAPALLLPAPVAIPA